MTKTIKICDKCGAEVDWLYKFPLIRRVGLNTELREHARHEMCEKCADEFIEKYNNYTDSQKEVSF
jgi:hypothetical protein